MIKKEDIDFSVSSDILADSKYLKQHNQRMF